MCKVSCFFFSGNKYIYLVKYQLKKMNLENGFWLPLLELKYCK